MKPLSLLKTTAIAASVAVVTALANATPGYALWFNSSAGGIFNTPSTPFGLDDDDHAGPIPLNFSFSFFGTSYTEVYFNSNGSLTFTAGRDSWDNYNFPRSGNDSFGDPIVPTIAPFFDDHDNRFGGILSFINSIPGVFVASWDGVPLFGRTETNAFQAVLIGPGNPFGGFFSPGDIIFNYGDLNGTGGTADDDFGDFGESDGTATIGLNAGDGVNFVTLFGLGIGSPGGLVTPADFPMLENPLLDPFICQTEIGNDGNVGGNCVAVPFSQLPEPPPGFGNTIPEPGTLAILGFGLAGLVVARRRRVA